MGNNPQEIDIKRVDQAISRSQEEGLEDPKKDFQDDHLLPFLKKFSKSRLAQEEIEEEIETLGAIYQLQKKQRSYANILFCLEHIRKDADEKNWELAIENIYNNRSTALHCQKSRKNTQSEKFQEYLFKLFDHIALELLRYELNNEDRDRVKKQVEALQKEVNKAHDTILQESKAAEEKIQNLQKEVDKAHNKLQNSQRDYITILGIFAAIVVTIMSGTAFSSSVLANIHHSSVYRLIGIVTILGMIWSNVLYYLFSFLRGVGSKNSQLNESPKGWLHHLLCRGIFWLNLCFIAILSITSFLWYLNRSTT